MRCVRVAGEGEGECSVSLTPRGRHEAGVVPVPHGGVRGGRFSGKGTQPRGSGMGRHRVGASPAQPGACSGRAPLHVVPGVSLWWRCRGSSSVRWYRLLPPPAVSVRLYGCLGFGLVCLSECASN